MSQPPHLASRNENCHCRQGSVGHGGTGRNDSSLQRVEKNKENSSPDAQRFPGVRREVLPGCSELGALISGAGGNPTGVRDQNHIMPCKFSCRIKTERSPSRWLSCLISRGEFESRNIRSSGRLFFFGGGDSIIIVLPKGTFVWQGSGRDDVAGEQGDRLADRRPRNAMPAQTSTVCCFANLARSRPLWGFRDSAWSS